MKAGSVGSSSLEAESLSLQTHRLSASVNRSQLNPTQEAAALRRKKVNLIFTFGGSLEFANLWIISYES